MPAPLPVAPLTVRHNNFSPEHKTSMDLQSLSVAYMVTAWPQQRQGLGWQW